MVGRKPQQIPSSENFSPPLACFHLFVSICPIAPAATSGALLGTFLAMRSPARGVRQLMTSAATSAASLGMLGLSFSAAKEYTRKITGSESPINSAVGGAAAGGLLFASHGGNPVLGAALVAALAAVADAASAPTIQGADASDSVATISKGGAEGDDGTSGDASASSWWSLGRWVRKQSEEERLEFLEKVRCRSFPARAGDEVISFVVSPTLSRCRPQNTAAEKDCPGRVTWFRQFDICSDIMPALCTAARGRASRGGVIVGVGHVESKHEKRWGARQRLVAAAAQIPLGDFREVINGGEDGFTRTEAYLCSPLPPAADGLDATPRSERPLFVYLPGIDGTGLAAFKQFPELMRHFNLMTYVVPPGNRDSFGTLVDGLDAFFDKVVQHVPPSTPVYVMGESFGGILAVELAARNPGLVDRVVLVNPATSYLKSLWPQIGPILLQTPQEAYGILPLLLAPVLGNPINLLSGAMDGATGDLTQQAMQLVQGAIGLLQQLPILAEILPRDTLEHKLRLLAEGCEVVEGRYPMVEQRVFALVGDQDFLLPSADEAKDLKRRLPRCHVRVERGRSHALLQEGGVNLVQILKEEGFYAAERQLSAPLGKRRNKASWGTAFPIELPTDLELERTGELTKLSRRLTSPVFISTAGDGRRELGLGNVPIPKELGHDRPVVFVGNHQSLALDMGIFVEEVLKERATMLRGLAHPALFQQREGDGGKKRNGPSQSSNGTADAMPWVINSLRNNPSDSNSGNSLRTFLEEFGATPVGGKSFARLLANKEAILLYPGGVSEAYRKKNQEYQLFWPSERSEFVRMCAKYNAIIVPFAGVGVDDSLEMLLDSSELKELPFIGQWIESAARSTPQARQGVTEDFVSPLAVPKLPPNRLYFLFGQPIETSADMVQDREKTDAIYLDCKRAVETQIEYLLAKRATDPYSDFRKRMFYETSLLGGDARKAPSFEL